MLTTEEKEKIRSMLPRGARKEIALKSGISIQAVIAWINGRVISSERAEKATLEYLREYKKESDKRKDGIV